MRKTILMLGLLLAFSAVFAETGAMIATDNNNADFCVAQAASLKTGYPLFIAENGTISTDVLNEIVSYNPEMVYVIGGPEAISENVDAALLDNSIQSTRVFGITEYGTATAIVEQFWPEGANETVVVTSNGLTDTNNTCIAAVSLAGTTDSPVIIIPETDIPSDTLNTITELNPENITVIGENVNSTIVDALNEVAATSEIEGDIETMQETIENETVKNIEASGQKAKLVIVATPNWKHALALGSLPSNNSVVRMVWNVDEQLPKLKTFIETHNITDIKVVGPPVLADAIKAKLTEYAINFTSYTDAKPALVAKKIMAVFKNNWTEKKQRWEEKSEKFKNKIIERIEELINKTEAMIAEEEALLEDLKAQGKNVTELEQRLEEARTELESIKANYATQWETALRRLTKAFERFMLKKWVKRTAIAWMWTQKALEEKKNVLSTRLEINWNSITIEIAALKVQGVDTASLEETLEKLKSDINSTDSETKKSLKAVRLNKIKQTYNTLLKAVSVAKVEKQVSSKLANTLTKVKRFAESVIKRNK